MKIRLATKKDILQIFEIVKMNSPKYPKKEVLSELNEMFSSALLKPTYFVVEEKGKILAFAGFSRSWADFMIVDLFWVNTHKDYQGQGIQKKLVENILKRIKKMKNPRVKMILLSTKIPAFFEKFGFEKVVLNYDGDYSLMGLKVR